MKTKNLILSLLIMLITTSCNLKEDLPDCSAVSCLALGLHIKLIDKTSGANYIDDKELELSDFMLMIEGGANTNFETPSLFKNDENKTLIYLNFIEIFTITIEDEIKIPISMMKTEPETNECCDFGIIEAVEVTNFESEYDVDSRTLTIKI